MSAFCYACKKMHKLDAAVKAHNIDLSSPFVGILEEAFKLGRVAYEEKRIEERGTLDQETMYLSQAGDECQRQMVKKRANHPVTDPPDIYSLMNFKVGDAVQRAVTDVLANLGGEIIEEHHVSIEHGEMTATGRSDLLIDIPRDVVEKLGYDPGRVDEHNLIEVKATGESAMVSMIGNGEAGKKGHRSQINQYVHASKLGLMPYEYDRAWLVYFVPLQAKGQPNIFPFEIGYSPALATSDLDWLEAAEKLAQKGEVPPIPPEYMAQYEAKKKVPVWPCGYCAFERDCWGEVLGKR